MKKLINGIAAAALLITAGQAVCLPREEGRDVQKLKKTVANRAPIRMPNAQLENADLQGLNLRYADFSGANLNYSNLSDTELMNVYWPGATLEGTNLSGARGLTAAQKEYARKQGAINVPE